MGVMLQWNRHDLVKGNRTSKRRVSNSCIGCNNVHCIRFFHCDVIVSHDFTCLVVKRTNLSHIESQFEIVTISISHRIIIKFFLK
jgi:hypothetical protein